MKNQQFASYQAGQFNSVLPPGYMQAATSGGQALAHGIQGGLQALAAGVMQRSANQRAQADRAREEAKEEEKQAKDRRAEFDRLDKQGQYMGLWGPDGAAEMNSAQMAGMLAGQIAKSQQDEREHGMDAKDLANQFAERRLGIEEQNAAAGNRRGDRGLDLQERDLNARIMARELEATNQASQDQGLTNWMALNNPEVAEIAAMFPGSAAALADRLPKRSTGWNLQPGQTVDYGDGTTGRATSPNSVNIEGPAAPNDVTTQKLEDGTIVIKVDGKPWQKVSPNSMDPRDLLLIKALSNDVGALSGGASRSTDGDEKVYQYDPTSRSINW